MNRSALYHQLTQAILNPSQRLIFLIGPRESGKTMLLKRVREDDQFGIPCMYCNFEDDLITQQFDTSQDIIHYLQIKYGVDPSKPHLILLNEIQYSKNSASLLLEIANNPDNQLTIIATGTYLWYQDQLVTALDDPDYTIIKVPPMSFWEFLEAREVHTQYINLQTTSKIALQHIKPLRHEYVIRGGYPAVVFATSEEHKRAALKRIIQKIIDKDLSFWFSREEYIKFTRFLDRITTLNGQRIKLIPLARELGYTKHLIKKYIHFLSANGLIIMLTPRSQDKTRELSKSMILYRRDTGILHYLQDALNKKIIGNLTLKTAIIGELVKQQRSDQDQLKYYQKTNGSMIDVIVDYQSHQYAIQITDSITSSYPKIFQHSPAGLSSYRHIKLAHVAIPSHSDTHITLPHELVSLLFG